MARMTGRSAFPIKKEMAVGFCVWLTYAVPAAVLYMRPKPKRGERLLDDRGGDDRFGGPSNPGAPVAELARAHEGAIAPSPE